MNFPPVPGRPAAWQKGSVSRAVQNAYIKSRLNAVNSNNAKLNQDIDMSIEILQNSPLLANLKTANEETLLRAFLQVQQHLQQSPLTINFNAPDWFRTENPFESYAQMYERSMGKGALILKGNKDNPADVRAAADDKATFPSSWMESKTTMDAGGAKVLPGKVNLPAVQSAQFPKRGLAPMSRDAINRRVVDKMAVQHTAGIQNPHDPDAKPTEFVVMNSQFDPKTKQVFAGVNYGRRPHGSTTRYGWSYFTLAEHFKRSAMYYAGDTFFNLSGKVRSGADDQLTYQWMGLLLARSASPVLRGLTDDLIRSGLQGQRLPDTTKLTSEALIVEAHLFQPVPFKGGMVEMCVSAKDVKDRNDAAQTREFEAVRINARKFAEKHGFRITFIE